MNGWEKTVCFFCGNETLSYAFIDETIPNVATRFIGQKFDGCKGGCPPYAIPGDIFDNLRLWKSQGILDKSIMDKMIFVLKKHTEAQPSNAPPFITIDENIIKEAWGFVLKKDK